jgi:hypothetical protein
MKSATDMFAKQTEADLKNTLDNTKLVNPETGTSYEKDRIKLKRKGVGKAFAEYAPALANTIASGLESKNYQKAQQDLANSQTADRMFLGSTGNRGDFDPNTGMYRPDDMVPVQFPGGLYNSAYGGPLPKALSGLEIKMQPGLYGTNGNRQFTLPTQVNSQKFAQQPTEVRSSLTAVPRGEANLEAEGGETALVNIDGIPAHFKISGNRHSKGGVPLNLPENSFIFSDTAKMKIKDQAIQAEFGMSFKKGGYTPAEIAKKFDINPYRKILADPNSEDVERKTAEMMISNLNLKLAKLGLAQESMKGFPQGIPVMAMPYIMSNEIDPSIYLPTQGQEEQPDADTGEARYGGNMIAQFPTKRYGGLSKAQTGLTLSEKIANRKKAMAEQQATQTADFYKAAQDAEELKKSQELYNQYAKAQQREAAGDPDDALPWHMLPFVSPSAEVELKRFKDMARAQGYNALMAETLISQGLPLTKDPVEYRKLINSKMPKTTVKKAETKPAASDEYEWD